MASTYPGTLDTLATNKANATATTTDHPAHHNDLADAVNKIEAELGVTPSGAAATVAARFTALDSTVSGLAVPDGLLYPFQRLTGETAHADDKFFTGGSPTGTAVTVGGTAVWSQGLGRLNCVFNNQGSGQAAARLWTLTPVAAPVTLETCYEVLAPQNAYQIGLLFTDGLTSGDNLYAAMQIGDGNGLYTYRGTLGAIGSANTGAGITPNTYFPRQIYVRTIWTAANTFEAAWSVDAVAWSKFGLTSDSKTMTPTHFGVLVSTYGVNTPAVASFKYVRVAAADLSV